MLFRCLFSGCSLEKGLIHHNIKMDFKGMRCDMPSNVTGSCPMAGFGTNVAEPFGWDPWQLISWSERGGWLITTFCNYRGNEMSIINDNVERKGGRQHHHSFSALNINPFERWHFEISLELTFVSKWVTRTKKKRSRNLTIFLRVLPSGK